MRRTARLLLAVLPVLFVLACTTIRITDTWRAPDLAGTPAGNIYVVAVTRTPEVRQAFENAFTARLHAAGREAVSCYSCIPDPADLSFARIMASVQQTGADALLFLQFVGMETRRDERRADAPRAAIPSGRVGSGEYLSAMSPYFDPPLVKLERVMVMHVDFYEAKTGKLIWTATTETTRPERLQGDAEPYARRVVARLRADGII